MSSLPSVVAHDCPEVLVSRLRENVRMAPFLTFKVGGLADWYVRVQTVNELASILQVAFRREIPFFLLGTGANVLVGDRGFRGLVIHNCAQGITLDHNTYRVHAESGAIMYPDLIEEVVSNGYAGLEHYVGIPSTVGGALWQNLHFLSPPPQRERTMFIEEVVHSAEVLSTEGERRTVDVGYFDFGYDYSVLHECNDVVLSATFQLKPGTEAQMRHTMDANLQWRAERHPPLDVEPSVGSIFKKIEGIGAGRLIDECGLKGTRIGGAMVTHRHANIFVNADTATAADVRALIEYVQTVVKRETGVQLETEIDFIGEFSSPTDDTTGYLEKDPSSFSDRKRTQSRK